jgi:hypothetical protein
MSNQDRLREGGTVRYLEALTSKEGTRMAPNDRLELTREEIVGIIDAQAQRRCGMTARTLLRCYRQGTLEDPGCVADLLVLSDLLPDNDPLFART